MNLKESLRVALDSIWANRLRAFLTMLGIVIGVAAVIAVVAIAQGGQAMILGEIEGLGSNLLWVFPQDLNESLHWERMEWMEIRDMEALQASSPYIAAVTPENMRTVTLKAGTTSKTTSASGVSHSFADMRNLSISQGRFFTREEEKGSRRVAVVASNVPKDLFDGQNPVGEALYIDGIRFTVTGVLEEDEGGMFADRTANDRVYVPYTALHRLLGEKRLDVVFIQAMTPESMPEVKEVILEVLEKRFGEDRFAVQSLNEVIAVAQSVTGIMTNVVAGIAAVALLVGGIGIMNIMLVSVTERTREIGIRKALGARRRDLLYQFLVEAVVLSGVGGLVGIVVGGGLVSVVARLARLPSLISVQSVVLAFLFAAGVGVLFGVYPASKAAKMDPIDALRYE
jgi:putative ABC transport system permease protein